MLAVCVYGLNHHILTPLITIHPSLVRNIMITGFLESTWFDWQTHTLRPLIGCQQEDQVMMAIQFSLHLAHYQPHTETDYLLLFSSPAMLPCLEKRQIGSGPNTLLLAISGVPLSPRGFWNVDDQVHINTFISTHLQSYVSTEEKSKRDDGGEKQTTESEERGQKIFDINGKKMQITQQNRPVD